jgi:hypothetical protein
MAAPSAFRTATLDHMHSVERSAMSPFRRVLTNALVLSFAAVALGVHAASAQFFDPALQSLNLLSEASRSARLMGMGGLVLSVPDRDNHISLWDFAGSPLGAFGEDSVGTIELRPATGSAAGAHNLPGDGGERQDLGARANGVQFEAFYRDHKQSAYGAVGRLGSVRRDTPYSDALELRRSISVPEVMPIFNGVFPRVGAGKLRYAFRLRFGGEHVVDEYRKFVENENGQYITLDGETVPTPLYFKPDEYRVNTSGLGGGLSYPLGKSAVFAVGLDALQHRIKGSNNGDRYSAEQTEDRPYLVGQSTLIGHFGPSFEYGVDGRAWTSNSEQSWYFTISAGVGAEPLTGRGKLLEREEEGSALKTRARWTSGNLEVGGNFWTQASKVNITPPGLDDPTSFNRFLTQVYYRQNADTLALPDSVVANEIRNYAWGYGLGASWKMKRAIVGAEWHWGRNLLTQTYAGDGPKALNWDIRSGLEYQCTSIVTGRVGYAYRWWDEDDYMELSEFKGHSTTLGMGLQPPRTTWNFESAWVFSWNNSDFGDPTSQHGTRQMISAQVNWVF